jgi:hypothetical protein
LDGAAGWVKEESMPRYRINWAALFLLVLFVAAFAALDWAMGLYALLVAFLVLAVNGAWNHGLGKGGIGNEPVITGRDRTNGEFERPRDESNLL